MVTHNSKSDLPLAILLEHMHKKFEINLTKIKGSCQSGRKVVPHDSKSDLLLISYLRVDKIRNITNWKNPEKNHECVSLNLFND